MAMENEGLRVTDAGCCLLCQSEGALLYRGLRDRLFGAPGIWSLMECPKCHLAWLNPHPIPEDIGRLYSQYFTHQVPDANKSILAGLRRFVKASVLQYEFGYRMAGSCRLLGSVFGRIGPLEDMVGGEVRYLKAEERGRLLDVGCGNGEYLERMRQLDWDVIGVEPDEKAACIAREGFGLEIITGSLEDAEFTDESFDAITMNHVIEHASDPLGLLKECRRILKPGGRLVVITPNIQSLGRRMFKEAWLHWDPPRHLFLFSLPSLRLSAERSGLDVIDLRTTAKGARWIWVASSLIKRDGRLVHTPARRPGASLRLQGLFFQAGEHAYQRNAGEEIVLIATR